MRENIVRKKAFAFALEIINVYKLLIEKKEFVLSKQLLRSGTAIGALIAESEHAESKSDFIHKLAVAQKEAQETSYWIELLFYSAYIDETIFWLMNKDLKEIKQILSSSIITTKKRLGKL